jgi:spermidine/putrescine transport system ATP-binding protein
VECDVRLEGVRKAFGARVAAAGVDLEVRRGEFYSLLGPSGCGKTTLMRLVAGFESPDAGRIEVAGRDMQGVPPHRRDVNLVFQNYALFPHLDVAGNVAFGLRMAGVADPGPRVGAALERVGLSGFERRSVGTLSGGEQQRVALARAVVTEPRVLLLDEPLSALDRKLRVGLRAELRRLQRELGMTFVFVTHDQEEALALSDRVAVLDAGRVRQVGPPREIYERPADRFVAEFVGAGNFFDGVGDGRAVRTPEGLVHEAGATGHVTLLIRPEKFRLDAGPGGGLDARVEEILYQGASATLLVRAAGRRILVEDPGAAGRLRVGESAVLRWKPEDVLVLPRS